MKLLTLNCHAWLEDDQLEKITHLAQAIKEKDYDVIALQEVNQSIKEQRITENLTQDNFAVVLLRQLEKIGMKSYSLVWDFSHFTYGKFEEGLAILTKHRVIEEHSFFVSKDTDPDVWKTRKIVGAKIDYNGTPISFYSCHTGWWHDVEEPFKHQADVLLEQVNKEELFFLLGDFNNNAFLTGEGYDYLMAQGLYDTYSLAKDKDEGITVKGKITGWNNNKEDLRIDLILMSKSLPVISSKVIFNNANKPIVSDHFGVEVEIEA
ncbi:endonuclease/exonuclease/phosphatase family protein [Planomicrobium sp. CPCC 101079]|uniref:endonuclease/exonuclease/phosphatase family protein n=1 Tax=Planomicrobium sp. CPCC 101079 TaxID=2599618 RepID=UPI0011B54068|nr:endonuclease/exonuclease/phosphatase family protein [Planomicrobium sp. CPCC 101079]TWT00547.1 endonuclease/exonuclease/phosphatase family protein [Planomicrobium sp. CPCC 101079]